MPKISIKDIENIGSEKMKMIKIEKIFVNSKRHAEKNIELIERLFRYIDLKKIIKVLEIGCGVGVVSAHLNNKYGMTVIGIDLDPEQVDIAKKYIKEHEKLRFFEADVRKLPFDNNKFDLVLSIFVIHHVSDWGRVLGEVNRIIKSNGYFIFYDIAFSRFTTRIFRPLFKRFGGAIYTIDDIIQFLVKNNFEVIFREQAKGMFMKEHSVIFRKK